MGLLLLVAMALVLYTYVGYPAVILIASLFAPRHQAIGEPDLPPVCMVVAAYNEQGSIAGKLANFSATDYPQSRIKLLIGSDASTDATDALVGQQSLENVTLVRFEVRRGKLHVLNDLLPRCTAPIVIFSDANTMFHPDAVKKLIAHFSDPQVGGVCGRLILTCPNQNAGGRGEGLYWRYESLLKRLESQVHSVIGANGAIYAIRSQLFEPFPAKLVMDDFLLPLRVVSKGYRFIYERHAIAMENTSHSTRDELRRKVRIAAADYNVLPDLLRLARKLPFAVVFMAFSHKVVRWFAPFLAAVCFLSNCYLASQGRFVALMWMQLALYAWAVLGCLAEAVGLRARALQLPFYLVAVNVAMAWGAALALTGKHSTAWQRVRR